MRAERIRGAARAGGTRLRAELDAIPGLRLEAAHRGVYEREGARVELAFEGDERIVLSAPLERPPAPDDALALGTRLSGNLRFARVETPSARGDVPPVVLVGDTLVDGVAHLPRTLAEVARSVAAVRAVVKREEPAGASRARERSASTASHGARERLDAAVAALGWPEDALVRQDAGWEMRPRLQLRRGTAPQAVRVACEGTGVRVRRTLLRTSPGDAGATAGAALAELALQLNGRARLARLALRDGALVVEARLRAELVCAAWLGETVRAVAAVSGASQPLVALLFRGRRLAEVFSAAATPSDSEPHEVST